MVTTISYRIHSYHLSVCNKGQEMNSIQEQDRTQPQVLLVNRQFLVENSAVTSANSPTFRLRRSTHATLAVFYPQIS